MTLRERIADWISGGALSLYKRNDEFWHMMFEAECRLAEQLEEECKEYSAALYVICEKTTCGPTRKVAQEALGPEMLAQGEMMFAQKAPGGVH